MTLSSGSPWTALGLSLQVSLAAVVVSLPFALYLGWILARHSFTGKSILEALISLPMVLPPVTTGYLLLLLFGRYGLIGAFLEEHLGIRLSFTWHAAVLAAVVVSLPLFIRTLRASFEMTSPGLEEAAFTMGCGRWRTFWVVSLPMALPGVISGALLAFARSLGEFGATITLAGNIEGETRTLSLAMFTALQSPGEESGLWWLAGISILLSLGSLLLSERLLLGMPAYSRRIR